MTKPKHKFVIRYKSGQAVTIHADELQVKWSKEDSRVVAMSWDNMQPTPLTLGLSNIESIWQEN